MVTFHSCDTRSIANQILTLEVARGGDALPTGVAEDEFHSNASGQGVAGLRSRDGEDGEA